MFNSRSKLRFSTLLTFTLFISGALDLFCSTHAEIIRRETYSEITPYVSLYTGDALRSMVLGGASYTYHLNRTYWFGVDTLAGTIGVDMPNGMNVRSGEKFLGIDGAIYFNLPALLGIGAKSERGGLPADLYTSLGVGAMFIDRNKEPFGFIGGGMIIDTPLRWLAVRFDLKGLSSF